MEPASSSPGNWCGQQGTLSQRGHQISSTSQKGTGVLDLLYLDFFQNLSKGAQGQSPSEHGSEMLTANTKNPELIKVKPKDLGGEFGIWERSRYQHVSACSIVKMQHNMPHCL